MVVLRLVCHKVLLAPNPDHPPWQPLIHGLQWGPLSSAHHISSASHDA